MGWERTLSVTPDGVPAPPKGELFCGGGKASGSSAKPLAREYPFRLLTAFAATFPKGTAFGGGGKVSGLTAKLAGVPAPPWGSCRAATEGLLIGGAGKNG